MVVMWLRPHNKRGKIRIRVDNGSEWFGGSGRKGEKWNKVLGLFEAEVYNIPPGAKHLMDIVENSHRADDEGFLIPQGEWFIPLSFGLQVLSHYPFCFMVVNIFVSG